MTMQLTQTTNIVILPQNTTMTIIFNTTTQSQNTTISNVFNLTSQSTGTMTDVTARGSNQQNNTSIKGYFLHFEQIHLEDLELLEIIITICLQKIIITITHYHHC